MRKKPLELSLYVAGAGAFGVFLRWLENQLAFEKETGLAKASAFHVMAIAFVILCGVVFWRFLRKIEEANYEVPADFSRALWSGVKLHIALRLAAGLAMALGGLLLLTKSETDPYGGMLRVLALLAFLSGLAYPFVLAEADREEPRRNLLCVLMLLPVLLYAVWLIFSYRNNVINSVPLSFGLDMLAAILGMIAYFRMAGFAFGAAKPWRALLGAMLCATVCIMSLADGRYMGMEIILLATAGQMLLYVWILLQNLRERERKVVVKKDDGFEHL